MPGVPYPPPLSEEGEEVSPPFSQLAYRELKT
jgi:hypothetical protein